MAHVVVARYSKLKNLKWRILIWHDMHFFVESQIMFWQDIHLLNVECCACTTFKIRKDETVKKVEYRMCRRHKNFKCQMTCFHNIQNFKS